MDFKYIQPTWFEELIKKYKNKFDFSIHIIDLKNKRQFGYQSEKFFYPASCYKIFIAAEVLRQVENGAFTLETNITIKNPNDVDKDTRIFPKDSRPLLKAGQNATIDTLLDLMLTRSDNTASNCLIDLVRRESITEHIIHPHGWFGSEVTRKFLDRTKEEKQYRFSETTLSCAKHLAEFFSLVETSALVSPFVSQKLKEYMLQRKSSRPGINLSEYKMFYGKGGWLETNLWQNPAKALRNIFIKSWAVIRWHNDVGIVQGNNSNYVISIMSVSKSVHPWKKFPMQKLAKEIFEKMEK